MISLRDITTRHSGGRCDIKVIPFTNRNDSAVMPKGRNAEEISCGSELSVVVSSKCELTHDDLTDVS